LLENGKAPWPRARGENPCMAHPIWKVRPKKPTHLWGCHFPGAGGRKRIAVTATCRPFLRPRSRRGTFPNAMLARGMAAAALAADAPWSQKKTPTGPKITPVSPGDGRIAAKPAFLLGVCPNGPLRNVPPGGCWQRLTSSKTGRKISFTGRPKSHGLLLRTSRRTIKKVLDASLARCAFHRF